MAARTVRWKIEGLENAAPLWNGEDGFIITGWHGQVLLLNSVYRHLLKNFGQRTPKPAIMVSLSKDGQSIARAAHHCGFEAIRGSATNTKKRKDKGGVKALIQTIRHVRGGGMMCITPDGPKGPARKVGGGALMIAERSGTHILPIAMAVTPKVRLNSWDKMLLPMPFGRGVIIFGPSFDVEKGRDLDAQLTKFQAAMDTVHTRAIATLSGSQADTPA